MALVAAPGFGQGAEDLQVTLRDGRVTIVADQVPVRRILEEWARVGEVRLVNLEKLGGPPVTLRLIDVPEVRALDVLLRSAAGYLAAPRPTASQGASRFDRVVILATSRPPATSAARPVAPLPSPAFGPRDPLLPAPAGNLPPGTSEEGLEVAPPVTPRPADPTSAPPGFLAPNPLPFPGTGGAEPQPQDAPPVAPRPGMITPPQVQPQVPAALPRPGFAPLPGAPTSPGTTTSGNPPPKKPGGGGA